MSLTKRLMPFYVILVIAVIILPQYVKAEVMVEGQVVLDAPSVHQDEYDQVVNIANESAKLNHQTWDPTYQGIWVGGSTPESLFKFNQVTTSYSTLSLSWEVMFSQHQIMNGASTFVVRLPIYSSSDDIEYTMMTIYRIPSSQSYDFSARTSLTFPYYGVDINFDEPDDTYLVWRSGGQDGMRYFPDDSSVTDGNDYYTISNRMYVEVRAPIIAGELYLFVVDALYEAESRFKMYISPNDVASDGIFNSYVSRYVITAPDSVNFQSMNYSFDLGFSFDFRNGIGGRVLSIDVYLYPGDSIWFWTYVPYGNLTYGYHTLMIPFRTENGTAAFQYMSVDNCYNMNQVWVRDELTEYHDFILVSSTTQKNVSQPYRSGSFFQITFTSAWPQRVSFILEDRPYTFSSIGTSLNPPVLPITSNITESTMIAGRMYAFGLFSSYMILNNQMTIPDPAALSAWDESFAHENEKDTFWDYLAFGLMVAGEVLLVTATVLFAPILAPAVVVGLGVIALITYYKDDIIKAAGGFVDWILGGLKNVIDQAWDILKSIGEFLWSVGEGIWNVLTFLYEAIMEYGSILLGLLIVGVAMLLYFYPLQFTIRIFGSFLLMAQGRLEAAADKGMATSKGFVSYYIPSKTTVKKGFKFLKGDKKGGRR